MYLISSQPKHNDKPTVSKIEVVYRSYDSAVVGSSNTLGITALEQYKWNKVAWCETHGNWRMHGATFSGGLGISNVVWLEYGGQEFAPHAGLADPFEQMTIAKRINSNGFIPDQDGRCTRW
jgi:hypothetical protein